jgi:hypothetical protein
MEKRIDETNRELTFESGHSGSARSYAGRRLAALRGRINPPAVIAGGPVRKVMKLCIIAIRSFFGLPPCRRRRSAGWHRRSLSARAPARSTEAEGPAPVTVQTFSEAYYRCSRGLARAPCGRVMAPHVEFTDVNAKFI